jgi:bleomycin hydrolase
MKPVFLISAACLLQFNIAHAQTTSPDRGTFIRYQNYFYQEIKSSLDSIDTAIPALTFKVESSELTFPSSPEQFQQVWHFDPISQGRTGTCWSFSTTSFFESEIYRLTNQKVDLSEIYTVYWEYVEKARRFIRHRGNSYFAEGSEANAVTRIWRKYGIVPQETYPGIREGQPYHDHKKMYAEMKNYLESIKSSDNWNEHEALSTIQSILNHYLGEPPLQVTVGRKNYTPEEYLTDVLNLNLDDYVDILSLKEKPYYQQVEYPVPDNWWHNADYYNVPLDDFMQIIHDAIKQGYSLSLGGDVSESGYLPYQDVAIIPTFDIPSEYINEDARQFRFSNKTTTDDHGIHMVGFMEQDSEQWYLIKDSGSGSRNGKFAGYYFYHEDYVKLKMMDFMVHRDMFKPFEEKFDL